MMGDLMAFEKAAQLVALAERYAADPALAPDDLRPMAEIPSERPSRPMQPTLIEHPRDGWVRALAMRDLSDWNWQLKRTIAGPSILVLLGRK